MTSSTTASSLEVFVSPCPPSKFTKSYGVAERNAVKKQGRLSAMRSVAPSSPCGGFVLGVLAALQPYHLVAFFIVFISGG
jgi:hypothetical protein